MSLPAPGPDRTAIVTGASSGIGAAIARELATRGHHVTLVARRVENLEALAPDITRSGGRAAVVAADLSDRDARAALPERVRALGLTRDILVKQRGLVHPRTRGCRRSRRRDADDRIDVVAVADLCTRFLPGMIARKRGALLNVASTGAFQPLRGQAGYGACKTFVLSYAQSLFGELAGTGVTTTVLCPGPVDTGFGEAAGFSKKDAEAVLPPIMWVSPEKVARTAVDALAKGRMVAIPGRANRAAAALARLTPNRLLVPLLARSRPGLRR